MFTKMQSLILEDAVCRKLTQVATRGYLWWVMGYNAKIVACFSF